MEDLYLAWALDQGDKAALSRFEREVLSQLATQIKGAAARTNAELGAGSGLQGLRDRVSAMNGTLEIDSPPGAGTTVCARLPSR